MAKKDDEVTSKRPLDKKAMTKMPVHLERAIISIAVSLCILFIAFIISKNSVAIQSYWGNLWVDDEPIVTIEVIPAMIEPPEVVIEEIIAESPPVLTPLERTIEDRMNREGKTPGLDCIILAPAYSTELEYGASRRGCEYNVITQSQYYYLCIEDIGCTILDADRL